MLNAEEKNWIRDAITAVEKTTDAELVAVIAKQSDGYHYIPTLWAALLALLAPFVLLLSPYWLDSTEIFITQLSVFVAAALVFRISAIYIRLIPKSVRYWRASNMARRQFLENNLHYTAGETGVLIFVSEAERYVEIIADRGISRHVDPEIWQSIIDEFVTSIKQGKILEGYLTCIRGCGEILAKHCPASSEKNELPNHLVVL